ncbi:MAG: acyltransferase [Acidobacteriia bacterium]|nr:acyltransferase [Terriglobia bacterium]
MVREETSAQTTRQHLLANLERRNIPALDGLRGAAALSVVAFHGWSQHFPGRMAVQVFFLISGLLITWLLLQEEERSGWINRKAFYFRRAFRLFPALFILLAWEGLTDFPHVPKSGLIAAAFYYGNYHVICGGELLGIAQTWSLAVEEHFYLIWPQIFVLVRNRRLLTYACFTIALIEFVWRIVSDNRVGYFYATLATETSSSAVLFGCGLALVLWYQPAKLPAFTLRPLVGAFSLVVVLLLGQLPERPQLLWGVPAAIPFAAIVVLQAVTYEWRILENSIARFLGRISYGVYLWGFVAKAVINWFGHDVKHTLLFAIAIAIGTISHYLIERPAQSLARRWLASAPIPATGALLLPRSG